MKNIKYLRGDATDPIGENLKFLCHISNSVGKWGAGFTYSLSKRWKEPEAFYRNWHQFGEVSNGTPFELGEIQIVPLKTRQDLLVVNMIAQRGVRSRFNPVPLDSAALRQCLEKVADAAIRAQAEIHMPMIGSGLAGGSWAEIEEIIQQTLLTMDLNVTVYKLN